jgi:hypothetical protein
MKKINRLPREQVVGGPEDSSTDDQNVTGDVEAHGQEGGSGFAPRLPGTGGDFRRPTGSGELDGGGDDVEGHNVAAPFAPRLPGTGGDFRRPSGGGEVDGGDDIEGHAR